MKLTTLAFTFFALVAGTHAQTNYCWSQETQTKVREIAAGYNVAWAIGATPTGGGNYNVLKSAGYRDHFETIPGQAVKIAVNGDTPWVITAQNGIWRRNTQAAWERLPGAAYEIAAGGGVVWVIGDQGRLYRWNGSGWDLVPGTASQVAIGSNGTVYIVTPASELHRYDKSVNPPWVHMANGVKYVAAGTNNSLLAVTTNAATPYSLYQSGVWKVLADGQGSKVALDQGDYNTAWMIDPNGILNRGLYSSKNCKGSIVGLGQ